MYNQTRTWKSSFELTSWMAQRTESISKFVVLRRSYQKSRLSSHHWTSSSCRDRIVASPSWRTSLKKWKSLIEVSRRFEMCNQELLKDEKSLQNRKKWKKHYDSLPRDLAKIDAVVRNCVRRLGDRLIKNGRKRLEHFRGVLWPQWLLWGREMRHFNPNTLHIVHSAEASTRVFLRFCWSEWFEFDDEEGWMNVLLSQLFSRTALGTEWGCHQIKAKSNWIQGRKGRQDNLLKRRQMHE